MSSKKWNLSSSTFLTPADGAILILSDAEFLNFVSFQGIGKVSGVTVDATFIVQHTNFPSSPGKPVPESAWLDTTVKKQFLVATDPASFFLEVPWAAAGHYRLKLVLANGVVDSMIIHGLGKG